MEFCLNFEVFFFFLVGLLLFVPASFEAPESVPGIDGRHTHTHTQKTKEPRVRRFSSTPL